MLTCELRVNGRLVGVVELKNDGVAHEQTGGEIGDYDVTVYDFGCTPPISVGHVTGFARRRGPFALIREALDAV